MTNELYKSGDAKSVQLTDGMIVFCGECPFKPVILKGYVQDLKMSVHGCCIVADNDGNEKIYPLYEIFVSQSDALKRFIHLKTMRNNELQSEIDKNNINIKAADELNKHLTKWWR